jgi:hypothetical protein
LGLDCRLILQAGFQAEAAESVGLQFCKAREAFWFKSKDRGLQTIIVISGLLCPACPWPKEVSMFFAAPPYSEMAGSNRLPSCRALRRMTCR